MSNNNWTYINALHSEDIAIPEEDKVASWADIRYNFWGSKLLNVLKDKGAKCYTVVKEEPAVGLDFYIERLGVIYHYEVIPGPLDETILNGIYDDFENRRPEDELNIP